MERLALCLISLISLVGCGNPGDISDAEYAEYKQLGAPKILYSCKRESFKFDVASGSTRGDPIVNVGYVAGVGMNATYNKILADAKAKCNGEFSVLDSKS